MSSVSLLSLVGTTLLAPSQNYLFRTFPWFLLFHLDCLGCQDEVLLCFCANERLPLSHTQRKYVARLEDLRETLENSPFFKTHEVRVLGINSSVGLSKGDSGKEEVRAWIQAR